MPRRTDRDLRASKRTLARSAKGPRAAGKRSAQRGQSPSGANPVGSAQRGQSPSGVERASRRAELAEFALIARIARIARGAAAPAVALGIGDDAAVLRLRTHEDLVVSTDARVERVHFRFDRETPRGIGRRAFAAGVSDLSAMGARPLGCLLSLAAPPALELATLLGVVRGFCAGARAAACPLVGGNLTRARELSLSLTLLGAVPRGGALVRHRARPGDRVFVTGVLGRMALERAAARVRWTPPSRLEAGQRLARVRGVGACIDLSDGLVGDLAHVCRASGVSAELDLAALPRPARFEAACRARRLDPEAVLLAGGEDYELLFTLRPGGPSAEQLARRLRVPVREIGVVVPVRSGAQVAVRGGSGRASVASSWSHF